MSTAKAKGMTLIVGAAAIKKGLVAWQLTGVEYDKMTHLLACSVLAHVAKHHEVSLADQLVTGCAKAVRKNALIDWLVTFGSMTYNAELGCFEPAKTTTNQEGAEAKPFWEFKPEPAYQVVDVKGAIAILLKNAEKRLKERSIDPAKTAAMDAERLAAGLKVDHVTAEQIAALKALTGPTNTATADPLAA